MSSKIKSKSKSSEPSKRKDKTKADSKMKKSKKADVKIPDLTKKQTEFDYHQDTWDVIDAYFAQNDDKQLVKHQLESFKQFINPQLRQIIQQFNPVIIYHDFVPEANKHRVELHINFQDYYVGKPLIHETDGSYKTMTPALARLRHLTYASPMSIDLHLKRILRSGDNLEKEDVQVLMLNKINFGKIPIMVQSSNCVLNEREGVDITQEGECKYDMGSCFIIGGNEKVIVSQERIAENKVFIFNNQRQSKHLDAEIKCVPDDKFSVAVSNSVKFVFKTNEVIVDTPNFRNSINIFLMLRALGLNTDKELVSAIVWDVDNDKMENVKMMLRTTLENYKATCAQHKLKTQEDVLSHLVKITNFKGINKEIKLSFEDKVEYLQRSFNIEVLPHLGTSFQKKAHFFGYMAQKLLKTYLGYIPYDDRDSYQNKRVDTPGILMSSLYRQCFNRLVKDMKKSISKELKSNKSGKDVFDVININNIYKIIKPTIIEGGLKYALATGNWSVKSTGGSKQKSKIGTAQVLNRLGNQSCLSHLRRVNSPSEKNNGKIVAPRKIHSSQWGYLCPAETPEGAPVGLVKNMSLTCQITINSNSQPVRQWLYNNGVQPIGEFPIKDCLDNGKVIVNGDWIGLHYHPDKLVADFKSDRRSANINIYNSICWNTFNNEIFIYTDSGRVTRPLYIVDNNKLRVDKNYTSNLKKHKWDSLLFPKINEDSFHTEGCIEFVDCEEVENCFIATDQKAITEEYEPFIRNFTHCEIHPGLILGVVGCVIPFPDHNQSPRNTYQSAMSKQAMSVSSTNYQERMDTLGYIMNNLERPIVRTKFSKFVNYDKLPNGLNAIIAVASYTGYNQEDSLILNQHALDRGLFRATFYRTYKDDEKKIQSSGKEEKFTRPNPKYTRSMKPGNYDKLDDRGLVKKNLYVDSRDIIIGKVLPLKNKSDGGHQIFRDCSTSLRINESGFVDKVYCNRNADGFKFAKIRVRSERIPQIGDKFSSRCGQKGTCGVTYPQQHMPFNSQGISPDAIMNPHAIPSRMTIGQLLECICGKTGAMMGGLTDCTPFTEIDPNTVGDILEDCGFERCGNEILYDGVTGKQMNCQIFMGPTFYQRLKHMVSDKMHSRSSGPVVQLTRQPAEGRSRDGGLRIGEMERDCMIAHGSVGFLKERMMDVSDLFQIYVCKECGLFAKVNPEKDIYKCGGCHNSSNFAKINIPYAYKLLMQELEGMSIVPRLRFDK
jgi:DNA-directed RNA polymerase II subunit RPB2